MAGTEVGSLYYDLNIDDSNLKKQLDDADKSVKGFGDKVSAYWGNSVDASKKFALAVAGVTAGVVAFGVSSVKAFQESQNAMAQTEAVIRSTGGAAGYTSKQIADLASHFEGLTGVADEQIQAAENMLLTFTNIGHDAFPKATQAVLDLSRGMHEDLQSASIQVGKALNDPVLGVTALRRVGVQLSDQQAQMVQQFVDTNQVAKAQDVILKELGKEFGGSAEAYRHTLQGSLEAMKNDLNNVQEAIGGLIAQAVVPLLDKFVEWFDKAGGVEGVMKKLKDVFERIKPDIPIIAGAIFGMLIPAFVVLLATVGEFILTMAPWALLGIAIVAVAEKIIQHFGGVQETLKRIKPILDDVKQWFNDAKKFIMAAWDEIKDHIDDVWAGIKFLFTGDFKGGIFGLTEDSTPIKAIKVLHDVIADVLKVLMDLGQWVVSMIIPTFNLLKAVFDFLWPSVKALFLTLWNDLFPALQHIWDAVTRLWNALNPALMDALKIIAVVIGAILLGALWLFINVLNVVIQVLSFVIGVIANVIGWIANFISWIGNAVGVVINAVAAIGSWFGKLPSYVSDAVNSVVSWFRSLPQKIKDALGNLGSTLYQAGVDLINGMKNGITDAFGKLAGAVKDAVGKAVSAVKGFLGIHSPSKVFHEIGTNVTQGFVEGIQASAGLAANAMSSFTDAIVSPTVNINPAAASGAQGSTTTRYGDTIVNVGQINNQQDEDWVIRRMDRNQQLATMGLSTR